MRRGAFTLVELLVAAAAASIILVLLYGSLVFYSRAYTREDEQLERSRRAQEILGLMRDDFVRADGELQPETIGGADDALAQMGYQGKGVDFLQLPRRGFNVINAFVNLKAQKPYLSKPFVYEEIWTKTPFTVNGFPVLGRNVVRCRYSAEQPPKPIRDAVPPWGSQYAAVHLVDPYASPRSEYVVIRKLANGVVSAVIWAFHRQKVGKHPPGTLLRWTEATGVKNVGGEYLLDFRFELKTDCPYADPVPPKRPGPWFMPMKNVATLKLVFGKGRLGEKADPGFEAESTFLQGP